MVVVAIIAILASLLLPSVGKARDKVRTTSCVNNQKQIGMGFEMHLDDNENTYPSLRKNWDGSDYYDYDDGDDRKWKIQGTWGAYQPNLDRDYLHSKKTFICPNTTRGGEGLSFQSDYSINEHIQYKHDDTAATQITRNDIQKPIETIVVTDTFTLKLNSDSADRVMIRHETKKIVLLWVDGHVSTLHHSNFFYNAQWLNINLGSQTSFSGTFRRFP